MLNKCLPSSSGLRHIIYKTNKQKKIFWCLSFPIPHIGMDNSSIYLIELTVDVQ